MATCRRDEHTAADAPGAAHESPPHQHEDGGVRTQEPTDHGQELQVTVAQHVSGILPAREADLQGGDVGQGLAPTIEGQRRAGHAQVHRSGRGRWRGALPRGTDDGGTELVAAIDQEVLPGGLELVSAQVNSLSRNPGLDGLVGVHPGTAPQAAADLEQQPQQEIANRHADERVAERRQAPVPCHQATDTAEAVEDGSRDQLVAAGKARDTGAQMRLGQDERQTGRDRHPREGDRVRDEEMRDVDQGCRQQGRTQEQVTPQDGQGHG